MGLWFSHFLRRRKVKSPSGLSCEPLDIKSLTRQDQIGSGSSSKVFLSFDPEGKKVAIKEIHKPVNVQNEINIMKRLNHPHIIRLLASEQYV